jgi:hypothetical protein
VEQGQEWKTCKFPGLKFMSLWCHNNVTVMVTSWNRAWMSLIAALRLSPFAFLSFIYLFIYVYSCIGGPLCHLQKFLPYIIVKFALSIILLYPPPFPSPLRLIPGVVSTGLIFPFKYTY